MAQRDAALVQYPCGLEAYGQTAEACYETAQGQICGGEGASRQGTDAAAKLQ